MSTSSPTPSKTVLGLRKLPPRAALIVTPLLLSVLMTCIVSFISTLRGIGLSTDLVRVWLGAWGLSWVVAFPVLVFAIPLVRRLTAVFVQVP